MSAEAVGWHMPAMVTLDDLASMNASDPNGHRYETSPEGVLSVTLPADSEHAQIASRLRGDGRGHQTRRVCLGGHSQYWVIDRDDAQTVTLYSLSPENNYAERAKMPLAWLLRTSPSDHLD